MSGDRRDPDELKRRFWEEHGRRQLVAELESTPAARLAWLEAAIEFARRAGVLPGAGSNDGGERGS